MKPPPMIRLGFHLAADDAKLEDPTVDYSNVMCPPGFVVVNVLREVELFSTRGKIMAWILWRLWPLSRVMKKIRRSPFSNVVAVLKRKQDRKNLTPRDAGDAQATTTEGSDRVERA